MRSLGVQVHWMQLLAVKIYEPFGTIRFSLYQFRVADEHAAKDGRRSLQKIMLM